ncbi:MAG: hypothetical protein EOO52_13230 [Gammaproteobacteria bacterium]|nr:MAG: hypothetical protein EOO52_13230 [Gammaproteobacteria bacterium]
MARLTAYGTRNLLGLIIRLSIGELTMKQNASRARESLLFPIAEANAILFDGLPGARTTGPNAMHYQRPSYRGKGWDLNRDESKDAIEKILHTCREKLSTHDVDVESGNWPGLIPSLPSEIQFTAYTFYYWSNKSDQHIVKHLRRIGVYASHPKIIRDHVCESCGKTTNLSFTKSSKHSVKCDTGCEHCGHSGSKTCECALCSEPDQKTRKNILRLTQFADAWIETKLHQIKSVHRLEVNDVKRKILDAWDVHFASDTFSSCSTSLDGLLNPTVFPHSLEQSRIFEMRTRFNEVDVYKIPVPAHQIFSMFNAVPLHKPSAPTVVSVKDGRTEAKIYVLSGSKTSKGFQDFTTICEGKVSLEHCFFESRAETGLYDCIAALGARRNDTVVIVRGGGDIDHESFNAFKSNKAADAVGALVTLGVFVIVGVGHASDRFAIDKNASVSAITPTDAAYKLLERLRS